MYKKQASNDCKLIRFQKKKKEKRKKLEKFNKPTIYQTKLNSLKNTCVVSTETIAQALEQVNNPTDTIHYAFHRLHLVICRFFKERGASQGTKKKKERKRKKERKEKKEREKEKSEVHLVKDRMRLCGCSSSREENKLRRIRKWELLSEKTSASRVSPDARDSTTIKNINATRIISEPAGRQLNWRILSRSGVECAFETTGYQPTVKNGPVASRGKNEPEDLCLRASNPLATRHIGRYCFSSTADGTTYRV